MSEQRPSRGGIRTHLLEHAIDLSAFDARFRNDATGAPAYPPALLLKVVLFAYSRGIVSSRGIERACQDHVTFIALCGDTAPHFTTIARFVSTLGDDIAPVFAAVVAICDAQGLIGRDMFAIDGVKLPSNASKHRSGTRAENSSILNHGGPRCGSPAATCPIPTRTVHRRWPSRATFLERCSGCSLGTAWANRVRP